MLTLKQMIDNQLALMREVRERREAALRQPPPPPNPRVERALARLRKTTLKSKANVN